ncbi:MAG: MBOAT family protein [Firmicutes bacterium]|nr:MBOAT family protein [Bacillota bacterium]
MLFSGIPFLFYFLPLVLVIYFAVPRGGKNAVLLAASLFFYGWGEPKFLFFMLAAILQGYVLAILIEKAKNEYPGGKRSKVFLAASVALSLGLLGYCKYADFFITNFNALTGLSLPLLKIALPIGISFYTFQIMSYVVDVYRGEVKAQRSLIDFGAYVAFFPQLIAGPIVRYADIEADLSDRRHTVEGTAAGVRRFCIGLGKKVLLANQLAELAAHFNAAEEKSLLFYWLYAAATMLYIYFDFSGYSDMAIGLGRIFGFRFPENFNYPYISGSITEFWRRWHMTLGGWFRDYLYIPLGGNRKGQGRRLFNIFIVWAATGLWHGAAWNFAAWGLMFAVLLMLEKLWLPDVLQNKMFGLGVLRHVYVLVAVAVSFVLFDAADMAAAADCIIAMFGGAGVPAVDELSLYYLQSYGLILLLAVVGATPVPARIVADLGRKKAMAPLMAVAEPLFVLGLLVVCTAFLIDGSFNPFLYFRF